MNNINNMNNMDYPMNNLNMNNNMNNMMINNMNNIKNNMNNPNYFNNEQFNKNMVQNQNINNNNNYNNNINIFQRGEGIDNNEFQTIMNATISCLNKKENPLSKSIMKNIKKIIGGDWVIFAYVDGLKGYDLSVSTFDDSKLLSFSVDCFRFEVIKIAE